MVDSGLDVKTLLCGFITGHNFTKIKNFIDSFLATKSEDFRYILLIANRSNNLNIAPELESLNKSGVQTILIAAKDCPFSRAYNMIFETIKYIDWDFGFFVRDGVIFKQHGWDKAYLQASFKNKIPYLVHFNRNIQQPRTRSIISRAKSLQSFTNAQLSMGFFFTLTPSALELVGNFNEDFSCDGHEDQEFSIRCCLASLNNMKNLYDLYGSERYFDILHTTNPHILSNPKQIKKNKAMRDKTLKNPIIKIVYPEKEKSITLLGIHYSLFSKKDSFSQRNKVEKIHLQVNKDEDKDNLISNIRDSEKILHRPKPNNTSTNKVNRRIMPKKKRPIGKRKVKLQQNKANNPTKANFFRKRKQDEQNLFKIKTNIISLIIVSGIDNKLVACINSLKTQSVQTDIFLLIDNQSEIETAYLMNIPFIKVPNTELITKIRVALKYFENKVKDPMVIISTPNCIFDTKWIEILSKHNSEFDLITSKFIYSNSEECGNMEYVPAILTKNLGIIKNTDVCSILHGKAINTKCNFHTLTDTSIFVIKDDNYPKINFHGQEKVIKYARLAKDINHNLNLGKTSNLFNYYGIYKISVSKGVESFKSRFKKFYNLSEYSSVDTPCLFFGIYRNEDINRIKSHRAKIFILWGGSDCDLRVDQRRKNVKEIGNLSNIVHFVSSKDQQNRLRKVGIFAERIVLNLTQSDLFVPKCKEGNKIYVYNGSGKNSYIYGKDIIDKVKKSLPNYNYIFSDKIKYSQDQMNNIYSQSFVGLRLTTHDAYAFTVHEMGLMGIPVIHNGDHFNSVPWKSTGDIVESIKRIEKCAKKKVIVVIYTYQRPHFLHNLLYSLEYQNLDSLKLEVHVYNDGSTSPYIDYKAWRYPIFYHHFIANHGKENWFMLIDKIYKSLYDKEFDYVISFADDMQIKPSTIFEATRLYDSINDNRKIGMNLVNDRDSCWTNFQQKSYNNEINICQWLEMSFICKRDFFEALGWTLKDFYKGHLIKSSGVPCFITKKLFNMGYNMYVPKNSIAMNSFGIHDSQMNTKNTGNVVVASGYYSNLDKLNSELVENSSLIVASLCSIPNRVKSLEETVRSLLPNVDYLHIFLNSYPEVPQFLLHPKIIIARSQDYSDMGDCNKFFWADKIKNCYHFVCDDDLIYTPKYFAHMIQKIRESNHRSVFSFTGSLIKVSKKDFHNYYRSRTQIHISTKRKGDSPVHICGTGALVYHTSAIHVSMNDFKHKNMADIWFSLLAQKQKVPVRAVGYDGNLSDYIEESKLYDPTDTIYHHSTKIKAPSPMNTLEFQTKIVRDNFPWILY